MTGRPNPSYREGKPHGAGCPVQSAQQFIGNKSQQAEALAQRLCLRQVGCVGVVHDRDREVRKSLKQSRRGGQNQFRILAEMQASRHQEEWT